MYAVAPHEKTCRKSIASRLRSAGENLLDAGAKTGDTKDKQNSEHSYSLRSPWSDCKLCLSQNVFQAIQLGRKNRTALGCQTIEPLLVFRVQRTRTIHDQAEVHKFFKVVIKGARTESVLLLRLAGSLLDDPVPVQVLIRKGEENMQSCGGKRRVRRAEFYSRNPTISLFDYTVKFRQTIYQFQVVGKKLDVG
jgi:hypothetical protein